MFKFPHSYILFSSRIAGLSKVSSLLLNKDEPGSKFENDPLHNAEYRDSVIVFLERFTENGADQIPDKRESHLPYIKRGEIYEQFCAEYRLLYDKDPPYSVCFFHIWKRHCCFIKVRKESRFAQFSRCDQLHIAFQISITNGKDITELQLGICIYLRSR